jgi:toxin YoeB
MKLIFAEQAWDDYLHWQATDKTLLKRINRLIEETRRSPFSGTGKPEPLKHALSGYWSRRINEDALLIAQLRYHYR